MSTSDAHRSQASAPGHWDHVYASTPLERTGWYEADPTWSLQLIERCRLAMDDPIIDVGAGASFFIDRLLELGYVDLVATDISEVALGILRERLDAGGRDRVRFVVDDLAHPTVLRGLSGIALWHDRATLHFLTEASERSAYAETLRRAVRANGFVMLAMFAPEGATRCSGLAVRRYDAESMAQLLGPGFRLVEARDHTFTNPSGDSRPYTYALFQRG